MKYSEFKTEKEFKKFLRENDLLLKEYFEKYEPKKDLLTGEKIGFEDRKSYFKIDFLSKKNMAKWLESQDEETQVKYILSKLKSRAKEKNWQFAPSQVECRSVDDIPSLNILKYCKNEKIWNSLGLKVRYKYNLLKFQFKSLDGAILAIDTREQKPLSFKSVKTKNIKLDFGDYCFLDQKYFSNVFIERKSIEDLWGTISQGYKRFCREIKRAQSQGAYLIVLIEYPFSKAQNYNEDRKFSKATPEFIFYRIREIMQDNENVQFVFCGNRNKSSEIIKKIGKCGKFTRNYDWQYCLDMGVV